MTRTLFKSSTILAAFGLVAMFALTACGASDPSSAVSRVQSQPAAAGSATKRNAVGQTVKQAPKKVVNGVDCSIVPRTAEELMAYKKHCTDAESGDEETASAEAD